MRGMDPAGTSLLRFAPTAATGNLDSGKSASLAAGKLIPITNAPSVGAQMLMCRDLPRSSDRSQKMRIAERAGLRAAKPDHHVAHSDAITGADTIAYHGTCLADRRAAKPHAITRSPSNHCLRPSGRPAETTPNKSIRAKTIIFSERMLGDWNSCTCSIIQDDPRY